MKHYRTYNSDTGLPVFYIEGANANIPEDAVEITVEKHLWYMNNKVKFDFIKGEEVTVEIPPSEPVVSLETQVANLQAALSEAQNAINSLLGV